MSARSRGRPIKVSEAALLAAIEKFRHAYETDPTTTLYTIAAAVGVTQPNVSKRVRSMGWVVRPEVTRTRKGAKARKEVSSKERYREARAPSPCVSPGPAQAPASVWQFAAGKCVATVRQDGRHVEVDA